MTFPERTIFGNPKGWKDKGEMAYRTVMMKNGDSYQTATICRKCNHICSVGIEEGKAFLFCGVCELKITV